MGEPEIVVNGTRLTEAQAAAVKAAVANMRLESDDPEHAAALAAVEALMDGGAS